MQHIQQLVS